MNLYRAKGQRKWDRRNCGGSTGTMVTNEVALAGCQDDSPCQDVCQPSGGRCASHRCYPGTQKETFIKHWKYQNKGLSGGNKVKENVPLCWISFSSSSDRCCDTSIPSACLANTETVGKGFCTKLNMGNQAAFCSYNTTPVTTATTKIIIIKQVHPHLSIIRWFLIQGIKTLNNDVGQLPDYLLPTKMQMWSLPWIQTQKTAKIPERSGLLPND